MGVNTRFLFTAELAFFSPNKLKGYVYFSFCVFERMRSPEESFFFFFFGKSELG
jgi:hypothetical protein